MGFSILLETLMMKQHTSLSQQSMHELMKEAERLTQHENTTHTHTLFTLHQLSKSARQTHCNSCAFISACAWKKTA